MNNTELYNNYLKSINQKYNAVCLDIDGTITDKNTKNINESAIEQISYLLKKGIPIVFITGRGETGINLLESQIVTSLKNKYNINHNQLKNMFALINDGARLCTYNSENDTLFGNIQYISETDDINNLNRFNKIIGNLVQDNNLDECVKITYSYDSNNKNIVNIRIILLTTNVETNKKIRNLIINSLKKNNYINLNMTEGIYENHSVLQIGTTKKDKAIEQTEKILGIPKNSMLRIGDCGDTIGNDFAMLDCSQGFSVDKTSGNKEHCFPVFNENKHILKGTDATIYLLKNAKLIRTVRLEKATRDIYTKEYSSIIQKLKKQNKEALREFNEIVNNNFNLYGGIYDLFDKESGSIKISMEDWELIDDNNPLKILWSKKIPNLNNAKKENEFNLCYSMRDNENYLLRGSRNYYYFLAMRESGKKDSTSFYNAIEWYNSIASFTKDSILSLQNDFDIENVDNKKMILGILDNMRNYLLISMNYQIISEFYQKNILINLEKINQNSLIYYIYNRLLHNETILANMCFSTDYKVDKKEIIKLLYDILNIIAFDKERFKKMQKNKNYLEQDYSKSLRAFREIDNFAENYITVSNTIYKDDDSYSVCGMCYGGIELPLLYKVLDKDNKDILLMNFNNQVSGYSNKQNIDLRFFNIGECGGITQIGIDKDKKCIIFDDNAMTGKTIQIAINTLYDLGIEVDSSVVVRYPGINRIDQMFMKNHSAIDYTCFSDYIKGLYFPCPYSWRDSNGVDMYTDSFNIFDLNRRKIIECLLKNHDYFESSEVASLIETNDEEKLERKVK